MISNDYSEGLSGVSDKGKTPHQQRKERLAELVLDLRGKLSQRAFARLIGVSWTAIQTWEQADPADQWFNVYPGDDNLDKLAKRKGWTLEQITAYLEAGVEPAKSTTLDSVLNALEYMSPSDLIEVLKAITKKLEFLAIHVFPGDVEQK